MTTRLFALAPDTSNGAWACAMSARGNALRVPRKNTNERLVRTSLSVALRLCPGRVADAEHPAAMCHTCMLAWRLHGVPVCCGCGERSLACMLTCVLTDAAPRARCAEARGHPGGAHACGGAGVWTRATGSPQARRQSYTVASVRRPAQGTALLLCCLAGKGVSADYRRTLLRRGGRRAARGIAVTDAQRGRAGGHRGRRCGYGRRRRSHLHTCCE